jgi:hypothetical protein
MRSLAVVTTCALFASMLAWSSSGSAAAPADTTLSFERDGTVVKTIDRRDLERACGPVTITLDDPYYGHRMRYRACPLAAVLTLGFSALDGVAR